MKKFIVVFIISFGAFAQDSSKTNLPRWSMGLSSSVIFFNFKSQDGFTHHYTPKVPDLRGGIELSYRLSKRSAIVSGICFFSLNYTAEYNWINTQANDPAIPKSSSVDAGYYDVPLLYRLRLISKNKIELYSTAGVASSFAKNKLSNTTTFQDNSVRKTALPGSLMSFQLGAGFQYNADDYLSIKIEPQYRVFTKGFDQYMYEHPTATVVMAAVVFKFRWKCLFQKDSWSPTPRCD
jgi:opacity protein-like surface antigen